MPGLNGIETFKKLKEIPDCVLPPVIITTANITEELKETYIKEGFAGYLTKPINPKTLNSLLKAGYPDLNGLTLEIKDCEAYNQRENLNLQKLMKNYRIKNKNFRDSIKNGFQNFSLLRLFYGKQFIQLYEYIKHKNVDISHLINSVTLNQIKNTNIDYIYDDRGTLLENINSFLEKLFHINNIKISEIYKRNLVLPDYELSPGLYRKTKSSQNTGSDLINNILNIYLNLTGNIPIINILLICNEDTSIE
jgi:CheY-like chemotaxis protein